VELVDRVAIVTGGATGLGRAIALALADAGSCVVITYINAVDAARATTRDLDSRSGGLAIRSDVSDWEAASGVVATAEDLFGAVSILVNNAGITKYIPAADLESVSRADWQRIQDVNVGGAFGMVRAVGPRMRQAGLGSILNVASTSAFTHDGSSVPYIVSKGALVSLTHVLARALAPDIRVNAVAPGWMNTPWLERYLPEDQRREIERSAIRPVDVEQVAVAAVGLIAADGVTGQILSVDNGEVATLGRTLSPTEPERTA
jgi:3-oxoacyl-[acyl-carrier protein] reductase